MSETQPFNFTMTPNSISIVGRDGRMVTIGAGQHNFQAVAQALVNKNWDDVHRNMHVGDAVTRWANGRFTVEGSAVMFDGERLPSELNMRIVGMAQAGEDPTPLFKFWERLQSNPSHRSVEQLWRFMQHCGIPLTSDGHFLAYKGVRTDFRDVHSGLYDNSPGSVIKMPRNKISDDPNTACHFGLHVGALEYANNFGPRTVICKVDPADVVCVPNDHSSQKMRVSKYEVVGLYSGQPMPNTTVEDDDVPITPRTFFLNEQQEITKEEAAHQVAPVNLTPETRKFIKKWAKHDEADESQLQLMTLEDLRTYATQRLHIVGASKILGGKAALVAKILTVR